VTLPPGPRAPALAQSLEWVYRPARFMERCQRRYGDYFTVNLLGFGTSGATRLVFTSDPEAVKAIFTADPAQAPAGAGRQAMEPMFGARSILLVDGQAHMRQRKLMLPPFHGARLARYAELMTLIAREQIARWPDGRRFALQSRMQELTLEIILRLVFGLDQTDRRGPIRDRIAQLLDIVANPITELAMGLPERLGPIHLRGQFEKVVRQADAALLAEIARRREDPQLAEREDILSLLLQARDEDGQTMSDGELRDQLVTLLLAGHETTATALAWTFDQLLRRPDALARARDEARGEARERPYLDAIAKEALRMRPPIPVIDRRLAVPFELGGIKLPAGTIVAPCIYLIHQREDLYPQPRAFRPERFLDGAPDTYSWLPFGGGVRRCLGASFASLEMRIVLQTVLTDTDLQLASRRPERIHRRSIVLAPRHGTKVRLQRPPAAAADPPATSLATGPSTTRVSKR
jgi:cytochrome P450